MCSNMFVQVIDGPVQTHEFCKNLDHPTHGAQTLFFGVVRNHNEGKKVAYIHYDLFQSIVEKTLQEIGSEARQKWGEALKITIFVARGNLKVGDASVGICVSSPHRAEAFEACRFVIESIKKRVPIWKKEYYEDGKSEWLKGCSL